jgi:hypothetical protein
MGFSLDLAIVVKDGKSWIPVTTIHFGRVTRIQKLIEHPDYYGPGQSAAILAADAMLTPLFADIEKHVAPPCMTDDEALCLDYDRRTEEHDEFWDKSEEERAKHLASFHPVLHPPLLWRPCVEIFNDMKTVDRELGGNTPVYLWHLWGTSIEAGAKLEGRGVFLFR